MNSDEIETEFNDVKNAINNLFLHGVPVASGVGDHVVRSYIKNRYKLVNIMHDNEGMDLSFIDQKFIDVAKGGFKSIAAATLGYNEHLPSSPSPRSQYIKSVASNKNPKIFSPFTGCVENVRISLGFEWVFHRVDDKYCLASQMGNVMVFVGLETLWVFPQNETILYVDNGISIDEIYNRVSGTIFTCLNKSDRVANHISKNRDKTDLRLGISDFDCPHMSHNLWNLQTGWANTLMEYNSDHFEKILTFSDQNFFGNVNELFDEEIASSTNLAFVRSVDEIQNYILDEDLFLLAVKDEHFTKKFTDRILREAYKNAGDDFVNEARTFREKCDLIVLTTVRLDNRSWIEQTEGLSSLFNALKKRYPGMGVIIDGLSSDTVKGWTTHWMNVNSDLQVAEDIKSKMDAEIPLMFAVGRRFCESIVLMDICDLFIAPSGSGMGIYKWVCNKPGLAFSNRSVVDEASQLKWPLRVWHDKTFRPDVTTTRHVPVHMITDGAIAREHVTRANFHLDWRDLLKESISFIDEFFPNVTKTDEVL